MGTINIPEILIVNGIGVLLMVLLRATWMGGVKKRQIGDDLYNAMISITFCGCALEAVTFLIDGVIFPGCLAISYVTNGLLFMGTISVGFLWCLFVDFHIHASPQRVRSKAKYFGIPVLIIFALSISSMLGSGFMFSISPDNVYSRGSLTLLSYFFLFSYYAYSLFQASVYKRKGLRIQFFQVAYFVIPCILGTIIQGLWYGISVGWTSVAIAMTLVYMQMQSMNAYMDSLSGLYNRRYLDYILGHLKRLGGQYIYGIYIDVNDFKGINDRCGHASGDEAIRVIGGILSESIPANAVAIRCSGDEFMVLLPTGEQAIAQAVMACIQKNAGKCSASGRYPFPISLAMGCSRFDTAKGSVEEFLTQMDQQMYAAKAEYYKSKDTDRRNR